MVSAFVRFNHKPGYKSCDLIPLIVLFEITTFWLERILQTMKALEIIAAHMVYNSAYNPILQTKETLYKKNPFGTFTLMTKLGLFCIHKFETP